MMQPDELKKNLPLIWSTGTGTEVWEMFCAAIAAAPGPEDSPLPRRPA
jgi:hypothetical protein